MICVVKKVKNIYINYLSNMNSDINFINHEIKNKINLKIIYTLEDFTFFLIFLPTKMGVLNEKRCKMVNLVC